MGNAARVPGVVGCMPTPRLLSRGMRRLLVAAAILDLLAGTQAFLLADHASTFFAWPIDAPLSAAFIGASFWAAGVLIFWCARQDTWVRARVAIPAVAVVVVTLLTATLRHLEAFTSPLGLVWIEVYALIGPVAAVLVALQIAAPGADHHSGRHIPAGLRAGLAVLAGGLGAAGALLFLAPGTAADVWPWPLTELTGRAAGAWCDDRADLGGPLLSVTVLAACQLLALALHPGQLDAADPALWAYAAAWAGALALGLAGVRVARGDGRYRVVRGPGGVPVEMVGPTFIAQVNGDRHRIPVELVRD